MLRFKEYLAEEQHPWQAQTEEELLKIDGWVKNEHLIMFGDGSQGSVFGTFENGALKVFPTHSGDFLLPADCFVTYNGKNYLPCKFDFSQIEHANNIEISDSKLSSFIGFPEKLRAKLSILRSEYFEDMTDFPKELTRLSWSNIPIEYNLQKYVTRLNNFYYYREDETVYKGMLSFFKIGLKNITHSIFINDDNLYQAIQIVNKHLESNERNLAACQTELLKNGLKKYAKL